MIDLRHAQGWVCPKCGNVYGPLILECLVCNSPIKGTQRLEDSPQIRRKIASSEDEDTEPGEETE